MFRMLKVAAMAVALGLSAVTVASATPASVSAPSSAEAASAAAAEASFMAQLHPKTGNITLAEADATLALGDKYYFLDAADTRKVLVDVWGNPPSLADGVLGMVLPAGRTPFNDWGAVVTFEKTGYVSDKDASTTNYDDYLKQLREGEASAPLESGLAVRGRRARGGVNDHGHSNPVRLADPARAGFSRQRGRTGAHPRPFLCM